MSNFLTRNINNKKRNLIIKGRQETESRIRKSIIKILCFCLNLIKNRKSTFILLLERSILIPNCL